MMIIRSLIFYAGIIPVTALLTFLGWIFFFTPLRLRYWIITRWSYFFIVWAKFTCGLEFEVKGRENIPKHNAIVFSNHQSTWETIFFQTLLPMQTWVLKKELLYIPIFGWGLALIDPISINRKHFNSIKELIRQGSKRLNSGRWVIIFPEGTRVDPGEVHRFTRSGAALAQASKFPILPIAHNAGYFWPRGFFIKQSGTIQVQIGPLIFPQEKTVTELNDEAEHWIRNTVATLSPPLRFRFEALNSNHFPLLLKWLKTPHVKRWWDPNIDWTPERIQEKYAEYTQGFKTAQAHKKPLQAFIIFLNKTPLGYIQLYNAHDFERQDKISLEALPHSLAAIDFYIGEPNFIGKGYGSILLQEFCLTYVDPFYQACFVDPENTNHAAIKTYKKAGFEPVTPPKAIPAIWMLRNKKNSVELKRNEKEVEAETEINYER